MFILEFGAWRDPKWYSKRIIKVIWAADSSAYVILTINTRANLDLLRIIVVLEVVILWWRLYLCILGASVISTIGTAGDNLLEIISEHLPNHRVTSWKNIMALALLLLGIQKRLRLNLVGVIEVHGLLDRFGNWEALIIPNQAFLSGQVSVLFLRMILFELEDVLTALVWLLEWRLPLMMSLTMGIILVFACHLVVWLVSRAGDVRRHFCSHMLILLLGWVSWKG